jgi:hypothetical protein
MGRMAWLVAMVPPALLLTYWQQRSSRLARATGLMMIMLAIAVLLMMLTYQGLVWWPQAGQWQRSYFWHRYGFSIATTVDVPIVQTLLIGMWLRFPCRSAQTSRQNLKQPNRASDRSAKIMD